MIVSAASQTGFLKFMILPFFGALTGYLDARGYPRIKLLLEHAESNLRVWEREEKKQADASKGEKNEK